MNPSNFRHVVDQVKTLLRSGCTVRNGNALATALIEVTGWRFPSNRYYLYKQIMTLLGAAGADPHYLDQVSKRL